MDAGQTSRDMKVSETSGWIGCKQVLLDEHCIDVSQTEEAMLKWLDEHNRRMIKVYSEYGDITFSVRDVSSLV
ncbi:hypothetical protein RhiJN_07833 [Ceratobasidium sp. AG-Ba]|nr:hypothetical protein RhiJN_07833 [Ceratobasidium sp. AG-Ba]QRW08649.1 hypothetical protein RhiLY_07648 [Ceratobasidium sp. AG-Ba]